MTPLFAAAAELQEFFRARQWCFCIIGGLALLRWGEPRFTRDIDVALLTGFGEEGRFIAPLLKAYTARIGDAAEFARRTRVLLLESANGVQLDISLAALPYERLAIERATEHEFEENCRLLTCSAEDLLIQKLFASRPKDLVDAEGLVARSGTGLDWDYVETHLRPLAELKDEQAIMGSLRRLRA